jgi:hypothetical protein
MVTRLTVALFSAAAAASSFLASHPAAHVALHASPLRKWG